MYYVCSIYVKNTLTMMWDRNIYGFWWIVCENIYMALTCSAFVGITWWICWVVGVKVPASCPESVKMTWKYDGRFVHWMKKSVALTDTTVICVSFSMSALRDANMCIWPNINTLICHATTIRVWLNVHSHSMARVFAFRFVYLVPMTVVCA